MQNGIEFKRAISLANVEGKGSDIRRRLAVLALGCLRLATVGEVTTLWDRRAGDWDAASA